MNREEKKKMLKHDPFFIESLRGRCQICSDVTAGGEGGSPTLSARHRL